MKKNFNNSINNSLVSDEMRNLIIKYMEACNSGQHAAAESLLHKINQLNKPHDDCKH